MEKSGWNWKTHIVAAALGFGSGWYAKNLGSSNIDIISPTKETSSDQLDEIVPRDTFVESILLMCSVMKEVAKDVGDPIPREEVESIDADQLCEEFFSRIQNKEKSEDPMDILRNMLRNVLYQNYYKEFMRFVINKMKETLLSPIPTVPSYVSKNVYDVVIGRYF